MHKWRAYYSDGSKLEQEQGVDKYSQIDRTKLVGFEILENDKTKVFLHLEPGQRLIYRKIGVKYFNASTQEHSDGPKTIMCGWQQTVNGKNIQSILYLTPDGIVHQTGRFIGVQPTMRPDELDG